MQFNWEAHKEIESKKRKSRKQAELANNQE